MWPLLHRKACKHWLHAERAMPNSQLSPKDWITQHDESMWTGLLICTHKRFFLSRKVQSNWTSIVCTHSTPQSHTHILISTSDGILDTFYMNFMHFLILSADHWKQSCMHSMLPFDTLKATASVMGSVHTQMLQPLWCFITVGVKHSICTSEVNDDLWGLILTQPFT